MTTEQERYERSCEILGNIVDRAPTSDELLDLSSLLGLQLADWYYPKPSKEQMNVIAWTAQKYA